VTGDSRHGDGTRHHHRHGAKEEEKVDIRRPVSSQEEQEKGQKGTRKHMK